MKIDRAALEAIIAEDESGLLKLKPRSEVLSLDERQIAAFIEIAQFVKTHDREPAVQGDIGEYRLAERLQSMRADEDLRERLSAHDELGLLGEPEPPSSLEEALAGDALGLLDGGEDVDLHTLRNVSRKVTKPERVAQREPCKDFENFEPLFLACHAELRSGVRRILPFREQQSIRAKTFYVHRGVLTYVASEGERRLDEHGRTNSRLRCIFENGTEADLLLRSFASQLYSFGKRVTDPEATSTREIEQNLGPTGFVYVLRSLSTDPQLRAISDVHKIGFTSGSVETRVVGAERSETFLGAGVQIVAKYEMPVGVGKKIEGLLHRFFGPVRLDVWFEREGAVSAEAREWFSVPLEAIEQALDLIESGAIQHYEFDCEEGAIHLRDDTPTSTAG